MLESENSSDEEQNDEQNSEQNSQLSNQPDFQALNLQYKFDNQKSRLENDVRVGMQRIESVAQELHLLEQRSTIFGQGFGIARRKHQFFHQESIQVNANYDQIRVIEGKQFSGLFQHETKECARTIIDLLKLRSSYKFEQHQEWSGVNDLVVYNKYGEPQITWNEQIEPLPIMEGAEVHEENGIIYTKIDGKLQVQVPSMLTYIQDLIYIMSCIDSGAIRGHCDNRLQYLQQKFEMHQIFNQNLESQDQKNIKRKDFTNIFKVDTHIHHSAAMSAKHLQTFIINKLEENPTEKVGSKDGQRFTLKEIFSELKVNHLELSLDNLDVQADRTLFKRFDKFSNKYNPLGLPKLREVFLKQDNFLKGKYLAELTREMFDILESQKYNGVEWRISVYGKEMDEWNKLAKWFIKHKLQCSKVRWLIQIPRLYSVYKKQNVVQSFQDIIDNIFRPLYDVTINPTIHPFLYQTLFQVVGFDTVDDESCYERISITDLRTSPKDWTSDKDPPYVYWIYYIYANMYTLNALRKERGLNTFKFRPHCGEAGSLDHLATTFLVADGINHGIELNKSPVLTYLFYLSQIGIAMSPVSNNKLFCRYAQSPFLKFLQIGLNVSLSTDDPLILHLTNEPLIEEFAIASQIFDLSAIDLAELSRNSVKQSGFEEPIKSYWAGLNLTNHTLESNNENNNNLPNSRFLYRKQTITEEHEKLEIQAQEIMF